MDRRCPANGSIVPTTGAGTWRFATADVGNAWAADENGWSLQCTFDEEGWSVTTNVLGDFFVNQPDTSQQATATCTAVDPLGAQDENDTRTWTFGTLYTATATVDDNGKNARLTITPTGLVSEFLFSAKAVQNGQMALQERRSPSPPAQRPPPLRFRAFAPAPSRSLWKRRRPTCSTTKPNSPSD